MAYTYLYGRNKEVAAFVASLIPDMHGRPFPDASTAIGVLRDNKPIAGLVYHNWDPIARVIEMSGAALPGHAWLNHETLARIYEYPFAELNCQMVLMRVAADNQRALRVLAAKGFSFVRIPRLLGPDRDAVVCTLTVEDWIGNKFNKRLRDQIMASAKPANERAA